MIKGNNLGVVAIKRNGIDVISVKSNDVEYFTADVFRKNYKQLEYIQSGKNQCIRTGVSLYKTTGVQWKIEIKFEPTVTYPDGEYHSIISSMKEVSPYPGSVLRYPQKSSEIELAFTSSYETLSDTKTIDGSALTYIIESSGVSSKGLHTVETTIFCSLDSNNDSFRYTNMKLYYCKIWYNNELVRDYIPAKRKSDSMCGLWDRVNETFVLDYNDMDFIGA